MNDLFLPFSKPTISRAAIEDVVKCLESGWITTGPRVQEFTEKLKHYLGAPFVLPLTSATAGLHLTLLAMGVKPGDEVITTPLTFVATLNAIVLSGAKPVLSDIDPHTLNLDLNRLEDAITPATRVIVPVHFAGKPIDCDSVYDIAARYDLRVLEDAAHAMGAEYKNRRIGSFGDTQVFSFHPHKNMTTGEGGCVATHDESLARKISLLRYHGIDDESQDDVVLPGYKFNMMDLQAAIGIHQLNELDDFLNRREELAYRYQEALIDWPEWTIPETLRIPHRHAWHIYTPLIHEIESGMDRDTFMHLMKQKNIGTGLHYRAVHLYPFYRERYGFKSGDFPIAENIASRIVSLPLYPSMTDVDHDRVLDVMYSIFR